MARPTLNLKLILENVHCHDEGDGPGNAEPYLWPIFFKIDGDSYALESGSGLIGFPTIETRNGHHGNLGNTDVDEGDDVPVPESLGTWQTTLKPIPINDPVIRSLIGDDLAGIAGVVVVLMEEDGWTDTLADTGYSAMINAVQLAVARVAAQFQHATHAPTKEEIEAAIQNIKSTASATIHDAIKGAMNGFQLIWYGTIGRIFGDNDDTIGSEVWIANHDDFAQQPIISFSRRWSEDESEDGDWEISGTFTGVVQCPAIALSELIGGGDAATSSAGVPEHDVPALALAAMREFHVKDYQALPGLASWWQALTRSLPDVIRIAARDTAVRDAMERLFAALPSGLATPDHPLSAAHLHDLQTILEALSNASPSLRRMFARRALAILPELQGGSWTAAIQRVARTRPRGRKQA